MPSTPAARFPRVCFRTLPATAVAVQERGGSSDHATEECLIAALYLLDVERYLRQKRIARAKGRLSVAPPPAEEAPIEDGFVATAMDMIVIDEMPVAVETEAVADPEPAEETPIEDGFVATAMDMIEIIDVSSVEETEPAAVPETEFARPYRIAWRVLGQYVLRAVRNGRTLPEHLEVLALLELHRERRRGFRSSKPDHIRLEELKRRARTTLETEVDGIVRAGTWLDTPTRNPLYMVCRSRSNAGKVIFFVIQRNDDGDGGKVVAVYDAQRFNRHVRQRCCRGYRNFPQRRS